MSVYPQQQYSQQHIPFGYQYPLYYGKMPVNQYPNHPAPASNQPQVLQTGYYPTNPQVPPQYISGVAPSQLPFYYYNNINEKKSKLSTTWTAKEDKLLRELKENQKLGWRDISTFFSDRTPNACQFRWRRIISSINKEPETKSRSSSISSISLHSRSSSLSSSSSTPVINKKSHHSINYILN